MNVNSTGGFWSCKVKGNKLVIKDEGFGILFVCGI